MRGEESESGLHLVVSTVAAFDLAISQPLLNLLGRHAEFFVARRSPGSDVILVAVGLTLVAPLILAAVLWGIRRLNARLGTALHRAVLAILMACLALQILKRTPGFRSWPGLLDVAAAVALGAGAALAYRRSGRLRGIAKYGAVLPVLVGGLFLFGSPASRIAFAGEVAPTRSGSSRVSEPAPVVMIILDEFPLASLMNERGEVDARLYPNFATLSREAVWFRNATTVHESTTKAIPAILTGLMPGPSSLPLLVDHPNNLFTLLAGDYDVTAVEPATELCPARICRRPACTGENCGEAEEPPVPSSARWRGILSDLRIVFLHVLLPDSLSRGIPSIDNAWAGFGSADSAGADSAGVAPDSASGASPEQPAKWNGIKSRFREALKKDRASEVRRFVRSIAPSVRPTLSFLHVFLPHDPWSYLPSGQHLNLTRFVPGEGRIWPDDPWLAAQAYQRHLLQVQRVDALVGELVAKLRREGLYDDTLLVITADHGASFRPAAFRRVVTEETLGDIAAVPLFIKRPHERGGGPNDRPVESIDVLPTIADVLGVKDLWKTDGASAFSNGFPQRAEKTILSGRKDLVFPANGLEKMGVVRWKYGLFASNGGSLDPFALGPHTDLIGRRVEDLDIGAGVAATVRLSDPSAYRSVDPAAGTLPSPLTGWIDGSVPRPLVIALAVNGTIRAVTQPWKTRSRNAFAALLPPEAFRKGRNTLRLFAVATNDGRRTLGEMSCRGCP